jgi:hypothetical protein
MRKTRLVSGTLLLITLSIALLGACSKPRQTLAPVSQLRPDIQKAPVVVREAYQYALANPDILSKIPCYCGCGEGHAGEQGHSSVKDCFVRDVKSNGTIVWDDMGLG